MNKYLIYQIEAFDKFDPVTQNYYNVKKIEVIIESPTPSFDPETEALERAKKRIKAVNYEVRACIERYYDSHTN